MDPKETAGTSTAAVDEQQAQTTTSTAGAEAGSENQAENTEGAKEEPARTGATETPFIPPAVAAVPGQTKAAARDDRSPANAVVIRRLVTYVASDDDVSHGVLTVGAELAAVIVKVNEDETVNLHAFAPDSAATLFLPGVKFGSEHGQCRF